MPEFPFPSTAAELILSSYRNPRALKLCLLSLTRQAVQGFSVCVAEDAEDAETARVVAEIGAAFPQLNLRHVQQPDQGFRKNKILNTAIRTSAASYLVFLDGDCLAHPLFVTRHLTCARPDRYLSAGALRLNQAATESVTSSDVTSGRVFSPEWLTGAGIWGDWRKRIKALPAAPETMAWFDRLIPAPLRWLGGNASTHRDNLLKVNGFDEDLDYGAEDKEIGVRLRNAGVRPYRIRYTAPILHLEHSRGYVTTRRNDANLARLRQLRKTRETWAIHGLNSDTAETTKEADHVTGR